VLPTPAPSAAPRQTLALSTGQAAQLPAQVLERIGPHGVTLAAEHREAHRPVERRQIPRLQAAGLPFLEAETHHPDALLDVIINGDPVAIQMHGAWQGIEPVSLRLWYQCVYVQH
jgi:hypothetical protein